MKNLLHDSYNPPKLEQEHPQEISKSVPISQRVITIDSSSIDLDSHHLLRFLLSEKIPLMSLCHRRIGNRATHWMGCYANQLIGHYSYANFTYGIHGSWLNLITLGARISCCSLLACMVHNLAARLGLTQWLGLTAKLFLWL
ncbi:hypothetical protein VNO77_03298 [Canavalia gladiata]|uniref:Uncharacterized protein n=1 Tax=Canavalia gladiata TaxID=3824 RepID=A0AAN9R3R0_CANGL